MDIPGTVQPLSAGSEGCAFADRCPLVEARCHEIDPMLRPVGALREAACILVGDDA